jgi:hypothetical protein
MSTSGSTPLWFASALSRRKDVHTLAITRSMRTIGRACAANIASNARCPLRMVMQHQLVPISKAKFPRSGTPPIQHLCATFSVAAVAPMASNVFSRMPRRIYAASLAMATRSVCACVLVCVCVCVFVQFSNLIALRFPFPRFPCHTATVKPTARDTLRRQERPSR